MLKMQLDVGNGPTRVANQNKIFDLTLLTFIMAVLRRKPKMYDFKDRNHQTARQTDRKRCICFMHDASGTGGLNKLECSIKIITQNWWR